MTYGEQQEAAATALLHLLNRAAEPLDREDLATVLACRRQVHLALLDRLGELGVHRSLAKARGTRQRVAAAHYPLHLLLGLINDMPSPPVDDRPPSALLVGPSVGPATPMVDLWRAAGRHLMIGNAELSASLDHTWRAGPGWWYVVGDLASTIDALIVIDQSLAYAGHLPRKPSETYLDARLAAGDVARVAGWRGTDPRADLAFAPIWSEGARKEGPQILLVRRPEDFAVAQRTLAGFMRPRLRDDILDDHGDRPGLLAARTIAAGHVHLAEAFRTWAERAGEVQLAERFRARIPRYVELHRSTLRMVELQKTRTPLVVVQQSELIQQLRCHATPRLSSASLHELEAATHEVAVNTGRALRREGMTRRNILVLDTEGVGLPGARPITNSRDRFTAACRALATEPGGTDAPVGRQSRARLTNRLATVDTAHRGVSAATRHSSQSQ